MKKLLVAIGIFIMSLPAMAAILPITGSTSVCAGQQITLSDGTTGGSWYSKNTSIATINSIGIVSSLLSGTDSIFYTHLTDTAWYIVTIDPIPTPIVGPSIICLGVPVTYSNGSAGGTWSTNASYFLTLSSSGNATGLHPTDTIISIFYSLPTGCSSLLNITINPLPSIIIGTNSFCLGSTSPLTDSVLGGIWTSSNPAIASIDTSGVVTGVSIGTNLISYSLGSGSGCTVTYPITVNAGVDSPIIGNGLLCIGHTNLYSDGAIGGTWSSSNTAIATVDVSGNVTGLTNGIFNLFYTISSTCFSSKIIKVNQHPAPITNYYPNFCTGININLLDTIKGGIWSTTTPLIDSITGTYVDTIGSHAYFNLISNGISSITYTTGPGCTTTLTTNVYSSPAPIIGPTTMFLGDTTTLYDSSSGGHWFRIPGSSALIVDSGTGKTIAIAVGEAAIKYILPDGCSSSTNISVIDPCFGMPSAGIAVILPAYCSTFDTLSLSYYVPYGTLGISHQWQHSVDQISWLNIPNDTNTLALINTVSSQYYRCKTTCLFSGLFAYSDTIFEPVSNIHIHNTLGNSDSFCDGIRLNTQTCYSSPTLNMTIYYGDGSYQNNTLVSGTYYHTQFNHPYAFPGTYSIKEILFDGTTPLDSVTFDYEYFFCRTLPLKIFYDNNANCIKDSNESYSMFPTLLRVDSNGITIDTISVLGGVYYKAYGPAGSVYTFTVLNTPEAMMLTCPSTGIVSFTLNSVNYYDTVKIIGLQCSTSSAYDLAGIYYGRCGRHMNTHDIYVSNNFCYPKNATVSLSFSPKYNFTQAVPPATSVVGNVITWNLSGVSADDVAPRHLWYRLDHPGTYLTVGDTAKSLCIITPIIGDTDTINNTIINIDTIKISYDPNEMNVTPQGYILPGAQLQYTINFENTGNDTALNIYVMDTLPSGLDPKSIRLVTASADVNIAQLTVGGLNIIKFDFPNINLLDSSHHGLCNGMVTFTIKTLAGLPNNTNIQNHAGIFFDDNPVVMTDTSLNIIGLIVGNNTVCLGGHITVTDSAKGGTWSMGNANATISDSGVVTGVVGGIDTINYSVNYANGVVTTTKVITINNGAAAGAILGSGSLCLSGHDTLVNTVPGGVWSVKNSHSSISASGVLFGVSVGVDTVTYTLTNACGITTALFIDTVTAPFTIGGIAGIDTTCQGSSIILIGATPPAYSHTHWYSSDPYLAIVYNGVVTSLNVGYDTIFYSISNGCSSQTAFKRIHIEALPTSGSILVNDTLCVGSVNMITETTPGGTWSITNSNAVLLGGGYISGTSIGYDTIKYLTSNACGWDSTFKSVYVQPAITAGVITGPSTMCNGAATIILYDTVPNGIWTTSNTFIANISALLISPSASSIVTSAAAGVDTIQYTFTNSCGTVATSYVITVNAAPITAPIIGQDSMCLGTVATMTAIQPGGVWQIDSPAIATISTTGVVTSLELGTVFITYSITNYCGTDTVTKYLEVANLPNVTLSGTTTLCIENPDTLYVTPPGGYFSKSNSNANIAQNGVVYGIYRGLDTIQYKYHNFCGSDSTNIVMHVLSIDTPAYINGLYYLCIGGTLDTLNCATPSGVWGSSNHASVTPTGIVTGLLPGLDTITYSVTNMCGTGYSTLLIKIFTPLGCDSSWNTRVLPVNGSMETDIIVYPNPNKGSFTITVPESNATSVIIITDMYGKEIEQLEGNNLNRQVPVTMNRVALGTYFIKVISGEKIYRTKVVIY